MKFLTICNIKVNIHLIWFWYLYKTLESSPFQHSKEVISRTIGI